MKTPKQFVNTLQDVIRTRGPPTKLISDSAQVEVSNKVHDILRYLFIEDWQSEAYHQHQNPAERRYQDVKRISNRLLDRTGSPPSLWLLALKYTAYLLNHTSSQQLDGKVPLQVLTGITQDISALLRFHWYESVYFREDETSFPSETAESRGRFVGFADHVGHALTFAILTDDTNKIVYRSEVRSAVNTTHPNLRANNWGDDEESLPDSQQIIRTRADTDRENGEQLRPMALIDVDDLIGRTFQTPDSKGINQEKTIVEVLKDHENSTLNDPEHIRFRVSRNQDQYDELMSYNDVMEHLEKNSEHLCFGSLGT